MAYRISEIRNYSLSPSIIIIAVLMVLFSYGPSMATVPATLYDQWTIPDSIYAENAVFVDLDNNGEIELLFENSEFIARYSLTQKTTLDFFRKPVSDKPRKFAYGFIDEDSHLDYIEVIMLGIHEYGINSLVAVPYLSSNSFLAGDSTELFQFDDVTGIWIPEPPYVRTVGQWGLGEQYFADDGMGNQRMWGEIRFDYSTIDDYMDPWYEDGYFTYRITYSYIPGEPSAQTGVTLPLSSGDYTLADDPAATTIRFDPWYRWSSRLTYCYGELRTRGYDVRLYSGLDLTESHRFYSLCYCPWQTWNDQFCSAQRILRLKAHAAGDFLSASPGYEFVVAESHYASNSDGCDCLEYHLRCFDLSTPESLTEEWDLLLGESEQDILFLLSEPAFPDQFFSFAHRKFISRNADGGAVMDSSAAIDESVGELMAYKPLEKHGENFAIFRNDNQISLYSLNSQTDVSDILLSDDLPSAFTLHQPYPNPFNSSLTIPLALNQSGRLTLSIFNLLGQKVADIFDGQATAGEHSYNWDGLNTLGRPVSSGIYLIKASTPSESRTVKCVLIK